MTNHIAPLENELRIPANWAKLLLPRRGRDTPDVKLDSGALDAFREQIRRHEPQLQQALSIDANREWADDAREYLLGRANPRGAAAVAALVPSDQAEYKRPILRPALDAWFAEFGLAFATAAAVERLVLSLALSSGHRSLIGGIDSFPHVPLQDRTRGLPVLRGLLADASDAEYAAAVAAVAPLRHEPARRMAAALLLPEETEWTDEASADFGQHRDWGRSDHLFWHWVRTPEQLAASGLARLNEYFVDDETLAAVVDGLGSASLPVLTATLSQGKRPNATERRRLLTAIAALPTDEAMALLVRGLHEPDFLGAAITAAGHFPVRVLRATAQAVPATPVERRLRLTGLAAVVGDAARDHLTEAERASLDELLASTAAAPEAASEKLPPLLTAPPWTRKRPKREAVVIEGLEPAAETVMVWAEGEQERWASLRHQHFSGYSERDWKRITRDRIVGSVQAAQLAAFAAPNLAARYLDQWNGNLNLWDGEVVLRRLMGRFGSEVAERTVEAAAGHHQFTTALLPIRSAAAARIAAERLDLKSSRPHAAAWFDRHGAEAAALLVPDALSADKESRRAAETALTYLARAAGPDTVRDAAKPYGAEAFEAISALLDADPLDPVGVKVPKPGPWAHAAALPQVLLTGRETALPAASVPHLITVLALGTPEFPYPGVEVAAEACDRESLRRFSWTLFEQWISVGSPAKDGWALTQLAHFADDATVGRLAALIREWPGQSQHKRAITGLRVLGAIGTEAALRAVHGISQKVKFKALKEEAGRQIEAVALGLGLSTDQLADRLVPDFGLAADDGAASAVLDYGPRQFKVGFDEGLKPFVTDMDGKPRKSLPKPGAKDDELLAQSARERFTFLKKEIRTVAADLVKRLESAMIQGRTWTADEFQRYFADHPLVRHLARRLVWMAETGGTRTAFRVAEDGTFSDDADDEFALPGDATVRLAHPVLLGDRADAWAEVLADYEILQPFEQLGRPVMAFTDEELRTGRLTRFEGITVPVGKLLGLTGKGWNRAEPQDAGVEPGLTRPLPGVGHVVIGLEPGIWVGAISECPDQTLRTVIVADRDLSGWSIPEPTPGFGPIDPVLASEALTALAKATGTA